MKRPFTAAAVALSCLLAATPAAHADAGGSTTLPPRLTTVSALDIAFQASAPAGVCGVSAYGSAHVTGSGSDWVLHLDPAEMGAGERTVEIGVQACDDDYTYIEIAVSVPFTLEVDPVVAPSSDQRRDHYLVAAVEAAAGQDVTAQVLHNGKVVKQITASGGRGYLRHRIPARSASGTWQVRAAGPADEATVPVHVARGWSLLLPPRVLAYPACSTVTWSYDPSGAPKGVGGIHADIARALAMVARASGLSFREVAPGEGAQIPYTWTKMGRGGPGGVGGMSYSYSGDDVSVSSSVALNNQSWWVKEAGFGRSRYGTPQRGELLIHETLHALGLGHVTDRAQIMYPVSGSYTPVRLAAGDKAGLQYLYRPQTCSA